MMKIEDKSRKKIQLWLVSFWFLTITIGLPVSNALAQQCPQGMISYWTFDDGTPSDQLGRNHGTIIGEGLVQIQGIVGEAFSFPPIPKFLTGPVIRVPRSLTMDIGLMDEVTLEAWVRYPQWTPVYHTYLDIVGVGFTIRLRQHYNQNGGWPYFMLNGITQSGESFSSEVGQIAPPGATIDQSGQWYHVVATYNSITGSAKLYVNGSFVTSTSVSPSRLMSYDTLQIGHYQTGGYDHYHGSQQIDEVAIYNRTLSAEEIQNHYNNGLQGKGYCEEEIEITIDIKPGSLPNSINLKSKGNVPVAILSDPTFDAATADQSTVIFAGASPLLIGESYEDVNNYGLLDIVLHFKTQDLNIQHGDTEACLSGMTFDGHKFKGCDSIRIVK